MVKDSKEFADILLRLGVISVKIDTIVTLLKDLISGIIEWKGEHQEETEIVQSFLNARMGKIEQAQALDPTLSPKGNSTSDSVLYQMDTAEFRVLREKEYVKNFR